MDSEKTQSDSNPPKSSLPPQSSAEVFPRLVFGKNPKATLIRVATMIAVAFVALKFALTPIRVTGTSMYPGYRDGHINFINRWCYVRSEPKRGDVVGVWIPKQNAMFLKRVVGLPGERIWVDRGWIMIDGEPLEENYLYDPRDWTGDLGELGQGEYYVMGDNRSTSMSRHYHFKVSRDQLLGKVLFDRTLRDVAE